jgi:hypothetical protein
MHILETDAVIFLRVYIVRHIGVCDLQEAHAAPWLWCSRHLSSSLWHVCGCAAQTPAARISGMQLCHAEECDSSVRVSSEMVLVLGAGCTSSLGLTVRGFVSLRCRSSISVGTTRLRFTDFSHAYRPRPLLAPRPSATARSVFELKFISSCCVEVNARKLIAVIQEGNPNTNLDGECRTCRLRCGYGFL